MSFKIPTRLFRLDDTLPPDRCIEYIGTAHNIIEQVMALANTVTSKWRYVRKKKNVRLFRPSSKTPPFEMRSRKWVHLSGLSEYHGSVEDAIAICAVDDDAVFRAFMKRINPQILHAVTLATIIPRADATPYRYIGLRWFVLGIQSQATADRDFCCIDVQDKVIDQDGNECYVRILRSIHVAECPSVENLYGFVRGKVLSAYIYRVKKNEPNVVRMHHILCVDYKEPMDSSLAQLTAESDLWFSVYQMKRFVSQRQQYPIHLIDPTLWIPNYERSECAICYRLFNCFRYRHHCRCCGEVICFKCSVFQGIKLPALVNGRVLLRHKQKQFRICLVCTVQAKRHEKANRELEMHERVFFNQSCYRSRCSRKDQLGFSYVSTCSSL